MADLQEQLDALLSEYDKKLQDEFYVAIADIQSGVILKNVIDSLERGDVKGAVEQLNITEDSYAGYYEILRDLMVAVGFAVFATIPKLRDVNDNPVVYRWNPRNELQWFDPEVDGTVASIISTINGNIYDTISSNQLMGRSAKQTAYDIFGIVNSRTERREGSVFGMSSNYTEVVNKVYASFLNNDVTGMRHYLTLTRRNSAYDQFVKDAIASGKKLDANTILNIMVSLKESYTRLRSESLAFTQSATILGRTVDAVYRGAAASAGIDNSFIHRTWYTMRDADVRHTHQALHGEVRQGFEEPFITPSGAMLRYPCDRGLGAGLDEIIGCRCRARYTFAASRTWNYGNIL